MKFLFKRLLVLLLIAFVIIQFFRPEKNIATAPQVNDITTKYAVPADVQTILKTSCYDCHSNNTAYPWYHNVQPVAWYLADHVKEGKRELNFSEFASYRIGKQYRKLESVMHEIEDNEMPLESYTNIHKKAVLTDLQKQLVIKWATSIRDTIRSKNPEDSLKRPQKQPIVNTK